MGENGSSHYVTLAMGGSVAGSKVSRYGTAETVQAAVNVKSGTVESVTNAPMERRFLAMDVAESPSRITNTPSEYARTTIAYIYEDMMICDLYTLGKMDQCPAGLSEYNSHSFIPY